jgi:hypothetical protein
MTDPLEDQLRRRKRQLASGLAALVLVSAGLVAFQVSRPGNSSPRQEMAAQGENGSPSATEAASGTVTSGVAASPPPTLRGSSQTTTITVPTTTPTTAAGATSSTTIASNGSQVRGMVLFGPTCPVERVPPDSACAPRPGPAHIQLLRTDGTVAAQGYAGSSGQFAISVAPGTYTVIAESTTSDPGRGCSANPATVTVSPMAASTIDISCDTGIR